MLNVIKISVVGERLVNNQSFAENFSLERSKIFKSCFNVVDLVKMESICILNRKPTLCGQKKRLLKKIE